MNGLSKLTIFPKHIPKNKDDLPIAFISSDFVFHDKRKIRINSSNLPTKGPNDCHYIEVRWRIQKNRDNGQKITQTRNVTHSCKCPVHAVWRILTQTKQVNLPPHAPITVLPQTTKGCGFVFMNDKLIAKHLQFYAKKAHHVTNPSDLLRWKSHSIRIGACVTLHAAVMDAEFIKLRLGWRSDAFRLYLRNVPSIALQHVQATTKPHHTII